MNGATSVTWAQPDAGLRRWIFAAILVLGSITTAAAAIVGDGSLLAALAPALVVAVLGAIWVAPMRMTLYALMFIGLAVDAMGDGGPWKSPLAPLGRFINENLDRTIERPRVAIPLVALVLGYLVVIHIHRLLSASRIDHAGGSRRATPLSWALGCSFFAVIALVGIGVLRSREDLDIQMAKNQVQTFILLLLVAYLLAVSLRGTRDYRVLGGLIIAGACSKALMALWVFTTQNRTPEYTFVTSHGDSMLFACAATILIARFVEQPVRRTALPCLLLFPVIGAGIIANTRRIAWVELAAAVLLLLVVSRRNWLKRALSRTVVLLLPLVLAYVVVGWNSQSRVFAPLQVFRSVGDADLDRSTLFRDLEDLNLLYTLSWNPFLGTGFGHPYAEDVKLDDISFFKEYHFLPHNSVLGLWAFGGAVGFTGLSMALVVGVFLSARSYWWARLPDERVAAAAAIGVVAIYLIHCYGDIGFSERESIFLVGPALAVAGRLALSTGAWGARAAQTALPAGSV